MPAIVAIQDLSKTYDGGFQALKGVSLDVEQGEILALLGPNGAGKTTLISIVCGIVNPTAGRVTVAGHDVVEDYREARKLIGLVPQEIALEPFEKVIHTVRFSRGLSGQRRDDAYLESLLTKLSLWDKRDNQTRMLSGGMKRRLLIAKALSHQPRVLFLDEPTAGVDVELRRDMWAIVSGLQADGVTTILTTHYLEEAEAIAHRVAVINKGELLLLEDKTALMERMGAKQIRLHLRQPASTLPYALAPWGLEVRDEGRTLVHTYSTVAEDPEIVPLIEAVTAAGLHVRDVSTRQSTLEEIFVGLVSDRS